MTASDAKPGTIATLEALERRTSAIDAQYQQHKDQQNLEARFSEASASELLAMWRAGKNERGRRLTKFETEALVEAFGRVFGEHPPTLPGEPTDPARAPPDDATLVRRADAAVLLGVSVATLDRMEKDGRLPPKTRLGKAIAGWRLSELHAALDEGNCKPRR